LSFSIAAISMSAPLQLYFRKFGRYPSSIDQLENTNNLRFLRKRYKDPITGTDEWKLIRLGQAHPKQRPRVSSRNNSCKQDGRRHARS